MKQALRDYERGCDFDFSVGCTFAAQLGASGAAGPTNQEALDKLWQRGCALGDADSCARKMPEHPRSPMP